MDRNCLLLAVLPTAAAPRHRIHRALIMVAMRQSVALRRRTRDDRCRRMVMSTVMPGHQVIVHSVRYHLLLLGCYRCYSCRGSVSMSLLLLLRLMMTVTVAVVVVVVSSRLRLLLHLSTIRIVEMLLLLLLLDR